jgi:hypothetical protein
MKNNEVAIMWHIVVQHIFGGIDLVLKYFNNEQDAIEFANRLDFDVEIRTVTDEELEQIKKNNFYID